MFQKPSCSQVSCMFQAVLGPHGLGHRVGSRSSECPRYVGSALVSDLNRIQGLMLGYVPWQRGRKRSKAAQFSQGWGGSPQRSFSVVKGVRLAHSSLPCALCLCRNSSFSGSPLPVWPHLLPPSFNRKGRKLFGLLVGRWWVFGKVMAQILASLAATCSALDLTCRG